MRTERFYLVGVAAILIVTATAACKRDPAPATDTKPAATVNNSNVSAKPAGSIVPGSYEDWCDEHQVPESQCTKCNPDLIPAFKAAGDWCNEHGMPESQCTKCDPKRKPVRPPKKS